MNVLLIGLRGAGKSTVGRLLAERLGARFVDLDALVLSRFRETSVTAVWAAHGEPAWREAERAALEEVLRDSDQVVALGGGVPMIEAARRSIEAARGAGRARVVYLTADTTELARRVRGDGGDRPSLTGADPAEEMEAVRRAREAVYRRLADSVHDTTAAGAESVAEAIAAALEGTRRG